MNKTNFLLPGYGDCAGAEFPVKVYILCFYFNTLNCRELFNIEDIFRINGMGLKYKGAI